MADILSLPNDNELLAAVGRIAMAHGKLDYVLRLTIKTVGKIRLDEARDGTKRLSSNELRKRVKRLAEKQFDDVVVLTRLEALLLRAEKVTEKRNRLIHDITYHTKSGEFVLQEDGIN